MVRLRTNYRGEEVYLYRLQTQVSLARAVLVDYLEEINRTRLIVILRFEFIV